MKRERYFAWLIDHRWLTLALTVALISVCGYGAREVRIDYGVEQFFLKWGPERNTYDEFKKLFPREDTRVSLFWKDQREPGVGMYRDMERVAGWFESAGLEDVRWFGNVVVATPDTIDGEPSIAVGPLVPPDPVSDSVIIEALENHAVDRQLAGVLWDSTQTIFLIHGYLNQAANTDTTRRRIDTALRDSIAQIAIPTAELVLTGLPIARAQAPKLLESDIRLLLGGAFLAFGAILYWYFRRASFVILSIASVAPAYVVVLGILGYAGRPMSILTSFIPIVVLVVGMSDAVHVLAEYQRRRGTADSARAAIVSTFVSLTGPCCYTSVTTAVGFASLAGTRVGIVMDFGLLTALAILLAFAFSMTAFPVLLSFAPDRPDAASQLRQPSLTRLAEFAARRSGRHSLRTMGLTALLVFVSATLATQLRTQTYLIDDTKPSAPFMQDISWIDHNGFGFFQVNMLLSQVHDRPLHSPEALAWMEDLRAFVRSEPLVTHFAALPDFFVQLRRAALGDTARTLPSSLEEASQLLLMAQLQDPTFVSDVYHEALGKGQVMITVRDKGSQALRPFLERLDSHLATNPLPGGQAEMTGTVTMIHTFTERLLQSFGPSIAIAIVLITLIMAWMLQSIRLGLIALLPNLLPLLIVLGATAALGYGLKPSTVLVLSIAFGIAVDDSIHLLNRIARHATPGNGLTEGMASGIRETGPIMLVTTAIVTTGFLLLTASHFQVLYLIGLMTAVSAVSALASDLFVLPAIVGVLESWRPLARNAAAPIKGELS